MIDEIDRKILTELQVNARVSFAELGRRVGLTTPAIIERVRKLEDAGYVTVDKAFVDRKPRTKVTLSDEGRSAFVRYLDAMQKLVADR